MSQNYTFTSFLSRVYMLWGQLTLREIFICSCISTILMNKRLLILTDTTGEQVNGVNRSIENLRIHLPKKITLEILSTDDFFSIPFFWYKEIRLSLGFPKQIEKKIFEFRPDYIHIETEWPIGFIGAKICKKYSIPYTTSFHTKFPEYLNMRSRFIKEWYVHKYLHTVHDGAKKVFISNAGMIPYIKKNKYGNAAVVPLGIDHTQFYAWEKNLFLQENRTKLLFVGRIAIEKNIESFLQISDIKYAKYVVGDWPELERLKQQYPNTKFLWVRRGQTLADIYRSVDIFVFPSKTDTLGLVNLEAMACWKPVVGYNIDNMQWIVQHGKNWILVHEHDSLESGIESAKNINTKHCIETALEFSWEIHVKKFLKNQAAIPQKVWK